MKNLLAPCTSLAISREAATPTPRSDAEVAREILADPGFGKHFTDHMVDIAGRSRAAGTVRAFSRTARSRSTRRPPCCTTGRKYSRASRHTGTRTARSGRSARGRTRSACSVRRTDSRCPNCPSSTSSSRFSQLIAVDGAWVPIAPETSLYLRPFMFAKEAFLGVRPAAKVELLRHREPRGRVLPRRRRAGLDLALDDYARAGKGGTGAAKTGGNYASSAHRRSRGLRARLRSGAVPRLRRGQVPRRARRHERRARLQGRHARHAQVATSSSRASRATRSCSSRATAASRSSSAESSIDEWREGVASGDIVEAFACGTAAVITPIGSAQGRGLLDRLGGRASGRAHDVAARGTHRHPVRAPPRPARLDAAARRLADSRGEAPRSRPPLPRGAARA